MAQAIVFASPWLGRMGWRHLYFEQGIQHVLTLIKYLQTPGPFKSLLQISLQWYQVITNVPFSPFRYPNFLLPYLDHPWFDCNRVILKQCLAYLEIPGIPLLQPKHFHDQCIMDGLLDQDLAPTTLKRITCCRLYLQVAQLSDISNLACDQIKGNTWLGTKPMPLKENNWPIQTRLEETSWSL